MPRGVVLLVALMGGPLLWSAAPPKRYAIVDPVELADTRWTDGFWHEQFTTCTLSLLPSMGTIVNRTERSLFAEHFRIAAGLSEGKHRGPPWNDGDYYKWLEALAASYAQTRDPATLKQLDDVIAVLAKAQRDDGYLHTPVLIAHRNGDRTAQPFQDRLNFEMYNFGHLFTAASVHHRATGQKNFLAVATKAADYLGTVFAKPTPELARNSVCPAHYMGIVDLYRVTQEPKYLALAKQFMDLRDVATNGTDDNQDRIPFRKQTEAVGHAVRANYLYAGAADVFLETGDVTLREPLERIWKNMVQRKLYVTGACGALYDGASPDGSAEQKNITRVHQAYGRDYQLPNSTAHNETCAAIGNVLWNWRLLQMTGDAQYADVLERTLYNALLAGVSRDGKKFFYTNTLRQLDTMPVPLRWNRERQEWISCYCCPPNVARMLAQAQTFAYGRSARGVWVHLYGASTLTTTLPDGRIFKLKQTTDFPWHDRVTLTIDTPPEGECSLYLRIPKWATGATVRLNDQPHDAKPGTYAEVRRTWKAGDRVELQLPQTPHMIEANPLLEETRNQVAVQCGPLVYCLESSDLPKDVRLQTVTLPRTATFTPRHDKNLLGGIVALETTVTSITTPAWNDDLYRPLSPAVPAKHTVRLIPYYAWGNRGLSEMSVWLPLGR